MSLPAPLVPVSWGELLDKIAILEIKAERIADPGKRANVCKELDALRRARDAALAVACRRATGGGTARGGARGPAAAAPVAGETELEGLAVELRAVNEALWDIEDGIRLAERARDFGPRFIALARAVYRTNDRRAALKRRISERLASDLVEEKSYADPADLAA